MIIACLRANYHIYFWAKKALFSILAAVKSTCNMFLSLASVAIITRCELWRAVRLSQLLSSFIMFSAFSSPSSSRAFPTLSSCVRSWAACVRWWRVTFSGSQVGVLQALKPHNDFLHKMKEGEKKNLQHHSNTHVCQVRSIKRKCAVWSSEQRVFLCSVAADCRDVLLPLVTDQLSGQLDDHSCKPDHEACVQLLSTVLDNLDRKDVVRSRVHTDYKLKGQCTQRQ